MSAEAVKRTRSAFTTHRVGQLRARPRPLFRAGASRRSPPCSTLFPFFLAAINAIKSPVDYGANGPVALPHSFDLTALIRFWREVRFGEKLWNSVLISGVGCACRRRHQSVQRLCARASARSACTNSSSSCSSWEFMVPQEALVYPIYYIAKTVGLYDTNCR